jgi:hypothetical protein
MSYYAGDDPDIAKPWFMRKAVWIAAAIAFCLLVLGLGVFTYLGMKRIPEIGGGITIEADPDTRIYMGDKLVGTTQVSFSWEELFGDSQHKPMAVELPFPAGAVTPELVSGPGAVVLESQALGGGGTGINALTMMASGDRYLIRRADGSLDQVMAIVIDWTPPNGPPGRYLLPVRLRNGPRASNLYYNPTGSATAASGGPPFMKAFGRSPIEIKKSYKFSAGNQPGQFAEEVKTKGLWEPGGE